MERFSGRFWTWLDREEFLVPTNVLDIVAGQTVTWMGLFYCPLLPLLNSIFIFLTFYIKKVGAHRLGWSSGAPRQAGALNGAHVPLLPPPLLSVTSLGLLGVCGWPSSPQLLLLSPQYTLMRNSKVSSRRFRASSSTFFFQLVLILGLLLATVPLGYVVSR